MIATVIGMAGWFVAMFVTYRVLTPIESFALRKPRNQCYASAAIALFVGVAGAVVAEWMVFG